MNEEIKGYELLSDLNGHWIGSNETPFGNFDWFSFDFRPISPSHLHSIYEGATNQNIITSIFIADFEGKLQIMARNGGWLGNQYRATYFVLDKAEITSSSRYYRLVDAIGRENRAYMEIRFENDTLYFDAYKDNSGTLDEPIHHMGFKGVNMNPEFTVKASELFSFPQRVTEVNLNDRFINLIDNDSALFLEEKDDPFPKSAHGHLSDLKINIERDESIKDGNLLMYISKEPIVDENGVVIPDNINTKVIRTIEVFPNESFYLTTYLHPDTYYITCFSDKDINFYPSTGDFYNENFVTEVLPETFKEVELSVDRLIN